jgi:hypothetical protein
MTKKELAQKEVADYITADRIRSVSNGYKSCAQTIKDMIASNKPTDEILSYCEWVLETSDVAADVAIKQKQSASKNKDVDIDNA